MEVLSKIPYPSNKVETYYIKALTKNTNLLSYGSICYNKLTITDEDISIVMDEGTEYKTEEEAVKALDFARDKIKENQNRINIIIDRTSLEVSVRLLILIKETREYETRDVVWIL